MKGLPDDKRGERFVFVELMEKAAELARKPVCHWLGGRGDLGCQSGRAGTAADAPLLCR